MVFACLGDDLRQGLHRVVVELQYDGDSAQAVLSDGQRAFRPSLARVHTLQCHLQGTTTKRTLAVFWPVNEVLRGNRRPADKKQAVTYYSNRDDFTMSFSDSRQSRVSTCSCATMVQKSFNVFAVGA